MALCALLLGGLQVPAVAGVSNPESRDERLGIGYDVKTRVPVGDFEAVDVVSSNPGTPVQDSVAVTDITPPVEQLQLPGPAFDELEPEAGWQHVGDSTVRVKGLEDAAHIAVVRPEDATDGLVGVTVADAPASNATTEGEPTESPAPTTGEPDPTAGVVEVNFSDIGNVYGGSWQDRLVVRAYPTCHLDEDWLTSPGTRGGGAAGEPTSVPEHDSRCDVGVQIPAEIDAARGVARFDMADAVAAVRSTFDGADPDSEPDGTGPGAAPEEGESGTPESAIGDDTGGSPGNSELVGADAVALAVLEADTGAYASTPFPVSSEWQVGVGSGEFSYGYDFDLPTASGGTTPQLGLRYSSGAVDGMSLPRNAQASSAGLGWELTTGYIARGYASCSDDGETAPDLCWKAKDRLSIVLNGRASRLVPVNDAEYRLRDDPGWKVQRVTGTSGGAENSDADEEAFKVFTPDGVVYWFGYGHGSQSTWTVPVFGNDAGEPGHGATFAASSAVQAWRWNLDRVVDTSDNLIEYTYNREINHYQSQTLGKVAYDRGGTLTGIRYGLRVGMDRARQQVEITTRERCVQKLNSSTAACGTTQASWPDVPLAMVCGASQACSFAAPSFFSNQRYDIVRTKTVQGSGTTPTVRVAAEYELVHTLPDPDRASDTNNGPANADLWLARVKKKQVGDGADPNEALTVAFRSGAVPVGSNGDEPLPAAALSNKVDMVGSGQTGSNNLLPKFRITQVRTELGGSVDVTYGHGTHTGYDGECTKSYLAGRDRWQSDKECFAQRVALGNSAAQWVWFHKYVVTKLRLSDVERNALGLVVSAPQQYTYEYLELPAWRYMDDGNVKDSDESWDDWRGYERTRIKTHQVNASNVVLADKFVSTREVVQFRGMDKARRSLQDTGETTAPVTLTVTESGEAPRDFPWLAGRVAEETISDPANSPTNPTNSAKELTRTYHNYDSSLVTAGPAAVNDPGIKARIVFEDRTLGHVSITGGTERKTRVAREIDRDIPASDVRAGTIVSVESTGDVGPNSGDETCLRTSWGAHSTKWLRVQTREQSWRTTCANTGTATQDADAMFFYDGQAASLNPTPTTLTRGLATTVRTLTQSGVAATALDTSTTYDAYGRVTATADAKGAVTATDYNPAGSNTDLVTTIKVTRTVTRPTPPGNLTLSELTELDPRWGLPVTVTDPNAAVLGTATDRERASTRLGYDAWGRLAKVWLPGRNNSESPSTTYTYQVAPNAVSGVKTSTLRAADGTNETRDVRYDLVDGWGRPLETQVKRAGSGVTGRVVSAVRYDEHGLPSVDIPAVPAADPPAGVEWALVNPTLSEVDRYTRTDHDALARTIRSRPMSRGTALAGAETTTTYHGTWSQTVPPTPLGATRTYTDGLGRTTKVERFQQRDTGTNPTTPTQPREMWAIYSYNSRGDITQMTAPGPATPANSEPGTATAGALTWSYGFDLAGRRTAASDPDTGTTQYGYDKNSNLISVDDATASLPVRTDYDSLNRPTYRYTVNGSTRTDIASWTYDQTPSGVVTPVTNPLGRLTEERSYTQLGEFATRVTGYDARGRTKGTTYVYPNAVLGGAVGSTPGAYTINAEYNEAGALTQATHSAVQSPSGTTILAASTMKIGYTGHGLLRSMIADQGTAGEVRFVDAATYTNINQPYEVYSTRANGGGTQARIYGYSPTTGRLTEVAANNFWHNYHYDAAGNIIGSAAWASDVDGDPLGIWCYEYDGLGRLTRTRTGDGQGYVGSDGPVTCGISDAQSNITTGQPHDLLYAYQYDRLKWVGSGNTGGAVDYAFPSTQTNGGTGSGAGLPPHAASSLTRSGSDGPGLPTPVNLLYDAAGRATKLTPAGTTTGSAGTVSYGYDVDGTQASTTTVGTTSSNGTTVRYAYNPGGIRVGRTTSTGTGTGTLTEAAVFLGDLEIRRNSNGSFSASRSISAPDGTPVGAQTTAGNRFVLADIRDTIRQTTNADSPLNPSSSYKRDNYYPYGALAPTPSNTPTGPAGPPADRGWLDKTRDPDGTIRLDHRNFTPDLNTLTTPDPLLAPYELATLNPYAYAHHDPITLSDPSGLSVDNDHTAAANGNGSGPGRSDNGPVTCQTSDCHQVEGFYVPPDLGRETDGVDRAVHGTIDFLGGFGDSAQSSAAFGFDVLASPFIASSREDLVESGLGFLYAARHPWKTAKAIAAQCSAAKARCTGSAAFGVVSSLAGVGAAKAGSLGRNAANTGRRAFEIHPRVTGQLNDPRLGSLRGRLSSNDLQELAHNPNATYLMDNATGHINVVQQIDGVILRITVPRDAFRIISVGRMRPNQIPNGLESGRFVDIGPGG